VGKGNGSLLYFRFRREGIRFGNMANLRYNLLYYLRGISARVAGGFQFMHLNHYEFYALLQPGSRYSFFFLCKTNDGMKLMTI